MDRKQKNLLRKLDSVKNVTTDIYSKISHTVQELDPLTYSSASCDLDDALELLQKVSGLFKTSSLNNNAAEDRDETACFTNDESLFSDRSTDKTVTHDDYNTLSDGTDRTVPGQSTNDDTFDSDATDDLENFDHYSIDDEAPVASTSSPCREAGL